MEGSGARFAELVQGPESSVPLDRAALLIADHAYPGGLDVEAELARIDELAGGCPEPTFESWRHHMFDVLGFRGSVSDYYDPANSFLNEVVTRRQGLPITLSVLGMEVGRRLGVPLLAVGMPGHFLLQHAGPGPRRWVDPFAGGRVLDRAGCEERFRVVNGANTPFLEAYLDPVGPHAVLGRMLANLKSIYTARGDVESLAWVVSLRLALPGTPLAERRDLARVLGSKGQFRDAAEILEELAGAVPDDAPSLRQESTALRARMN
ncbi:MAG: transglutaminase-like domain-containing protein [Actinomycetota bacterium]|jgi:regulator of sirC expression with transglutaminase-like and TPR domain